jgi:ATP-dependent exoDNAse (exonuclease V) beta subunit
MELAERKRLLYVAMTRARDGLGLFVQSGGTEKDTFKSWLLKACDLDFDDLFVGSRQISLQKGADKASLYLKDCNDNPEQGEDNASHFLIAPRSGPKEEANESAEELMDSVAVNCLVPKSRLESYFEPSLELLAPLEAQPLSLPSAWQACERVTFDSNEKKISATVLGSFFHSLMENMPSDGRMLSPAEIEAIAFAQPEVIPLPNSLAALVQAGTALLQQFYNSDFFQIYVKARRRFHEWPYLIRASDGGDYARRPDLLLELNQSDWLLVDYKTDTFEPEQLKKHSMSHSKQLETYVSELNDLLGIDLVAYIYYAQYGFFYRC